MNNRLTIKTTEQINRLSVAVDGVTNQLTVNTVSNRVLLRSNTYNIATSQIVFSPTEPSNPYEGMVWFKIN